MGSASFLPNCGGRWNGFAGKVVGLARSREYRGLFIIFSIALLLYLLIIPSVVIKNSAQREANAFTAKLREFSGLSVEYTALKRRVDTLEQRNTLRTRGSVIQTVDELFSSAGIRGKIKSVKATGSSAIDSTASEERAELQAERLTLNELINVLYRVENAPYMLSIRNVTIRKTFENPKLLDVTMVISLITSSSDRK